MAGDGLSGQHYEFSDIDLLARELDDARVWANTSKAGPIAETK